MRGGGSSFGGQSASRGQVDEEVYGSVYDQKVILRLFPYLKPYRKMVIIAAISMLIYTFTMVAVPWVIAKGIDGFIQKDDLNGLTWIFGVFMINIIQILCSTNCTTCISGGWRNMNILKWTFFHYFVISYSI